MTLERKCLRCGHWPCPFCEDWCDVVLRYEVVVDDNESELARHMREGGNMLPEPVLCCDGQCIYAEPLASSDAPRSRAPVETCIATSLPGARANAASIKIARRLLPPWRRRRRGVNYDED